MKFICISKTGDLKIGRTYTGRKVGSQIQIDDELHDFDNFTFARTPDDTLGWKIIKHVCEIDKEVGNVSKANNQIESDELRFIRMLEQNRNKAGFRQRWRAFMSKLFK